MWRSVAKQMPALTRAAARSSQVAVVQLTAARKIAVQTRALSSSATDDYALNLAKVLAPEQTLEEFKQLYRTPGVKHTTVIKIGGDVIIHELDTLIESLRFMKDTGLFPILVHGAGPQMNAELDKQGVEPQYVGGNRVTDQKTLDIAKTIFIDTNATLVAALNKAGVPPRASPAASSRPSSRTRTSTASWAR